MIRGPAQVARTPQKQWSTVSMHVGAPAHSSGPSMWWHFEEKQHSRLESTQAVFEVKGPRMLFHRNKETLRCQSVARFTHWLAKIVGHWFLSLQSRAAERRGEEGVAARLKWWRRVHESSHRGRKRRLQITIPAAHTAVEQAAEGETSWTAC